MSRGWPVLLLYGALAGSPAMAQEGGLLATPACQQALQALEAREAAAARDRGLRGALDAARRQAATACLGARGAALAPPRGARPAAAAPATAPRPALPTAPPAPVAVVPPPVPRPSAPLTVTACDATGCWASDGSRLQRVGPNLLGPQGQTCSTSGTLLHCPQ